MMLSCPEIHQRVVEECANMVTIGSDELTSATASEGSSGGVGSCAAAASGVSDDRLGGEACAKTNCPMVSTTTNTSFTSETFQCLRVIRHIVAAISGQRNGLVRYPRPCKPHPS